MSLPRIKVALPMYGPIYPKFVIHWLEFQAQLARYDGYAGLIVTEVAPVDLAMNNIVTDALKDPKWDWLLVIEQDMRLPAGLLERVGSLNPETHPIVGCLYFGRAQDNQAPIPGYWRKGRLHRLSYEEVCAMLPQRGGTAGLHRVDTVGMGATAIHRSVLEQWPWTPSHPWFRFDYDHMGPIGHDVWFCVEAGRLGYPVHVDSSLIAKHIGDWQSDDVTYLATTEHARSLSAATQSTQTNPIVVAPHTEGGLRDETLAALEATDLSCELIRLEQDHEYHDVIADHWRLGDTFLVVEQDIVPPEGALRELADCPHPWCAFAYEYPPFGLYAGMGCAKFSAELMRRFPDALTKIGKWSDDDHPPKHWCRLDGWLKQYLLEQGVEQHIHGVVEHLHQGKPAHDCVKQPPLPRDMPSALTDDEAHELERLAAGGFVLEIGADLGFSTVVMARSAHHVTSVDWHQGDGFTGHQDTEGAFRANLRSHGVANVAVAVSRFEDWSPSASAYDLIFIDADHSYEAVKRHIELALPLLRKGGVLALHDYGREGMGVTQAATELLGEPDHVVDTLAVYSPRTT